MSSGSVLFPKTGSAAPAASTARSESDLDEAELRSRAQEDASVIYARPRAHKTRTLSESGHAPHTVIRQRQTYLANQTPPSRARRLSHDETSAKPRKFLVDVEETIKLVLEQEDTDGNFQIAATDKGPKVFTLGTASSNGYNSCEIRGTYMLSNLLQELALARDHGQKTIVLDEARLSENPVSRLSRMIRYSFWSNLTRRIDGDGLEAICADPKNRGRNQAPRIYVPEVEVQMRRYYERIAKEKPHLGLIVSTIPREFTPEWVRDRNEEPGILALAMTEIKGAEGEDSDFKGIPFVVPGARFNELYYWDSYFVSLGLISDGHIDLARGIVEHFLFEIKHYGKVLNGNRSYYLCRSQPPFLTDLILQVFANLNPEDAKENKAWLKRAIQGAIREYHIVWMNASRRLDTLTGLSRYRPEGVGIPPETEASHFTYVLQPYADKLGISVNEFTEKYTAGEVSVPALDEYFLHDRGVRESGHDTTYRFEKRCANLGTIDLCSLLYKYEVDIATVIRDHFGDSLDLEEDYALSAFPFGTEVPYKGPRELVAEAGRRSTQVKQTSAEWFARAGRRKQLADHYLWHEGRGLYTDYDCTKHKQSLYDTVTTFWPMWCGMASEQQADKIMKCSLVKFEALGGLLSGTESSRGRISLTRPNRQWDYPAAWPPHQIMAWGGMQKYGYVHDAQRVAYRWLYMVTIGFVEAAGCVPEKFNAVEASSNIDAEYGNQGTDFALIPREGFGWTNASYQLGLDVITSHQRRALGALTSPDVFFSRSPVSANAPSGDR
ncbi:alpha,alpha-trehalase [Microbotryum lychnidis-dioicae p1A1 Lamole]|uniref:Trehalase n=1 Tax=Microbotryum lychnidis-dioicae (strain p1A1 Lamole / MvSl-1064) TaxID=683840 RepID=U5HBZ5_USTV1|nr:alpha,alpha-trehalase [Microbotryum lychnidis-dioicae p1A1 Lamole]|eukprot:KDE04929.1 alpha,alpha-trehalase [Microbotryum lychnidis-dioicae p1A1 Lamole]